MKHDTARDILEIIFDVAKQLDHSIRHAQDECTDEEFREYRKRVALVLTHLMDVYRPILDEHPDLRPPGLKS